MPQFWGADSVAYMDETVNGTTLANYVINSQYAGSPHDQIVWWGRYFDYGTSSGNSHYRASESTALSNAVRGYSNPTGGKCWVLPIAKPYPPIGPSSTMATGMTDGNYVAATINGLLSSTLHLPGSLECFVYLDIENGQHVSAAYVDGWMAAVNGYEASDGELAFYGAAYVNPNDSTDVNAISTAECFQAWSPIPEPTCSGCDSPGPAWGPTAVPGKPTNVWQYGEANSACTSCRNQTIYVDLDLTNPSVAGPYGYGQCDYMLFI